MKQRSGARIVPMNQEKVHTHSKVLLSKLQHSMNSIRTKLTTQQTIKSRANFHDHTQQLGNPNKSLPCIPDSKSSLKSQSH